MAGSAKAYIVEDIVALLRQARKEGRISQTELARRTSLSQNHVSNIENGKVDPLSSTLIEIARALGMDLVLVSRRKLPIVKALLSGVDAQQPLYRPDEDDDD